MIETTEFRVKFGSRFCTDQFGFVRSGTITVGPGHLRVSGPVHWSRLKRLLCAIVLLVVFFNLSGYLIAQALTSTQGSAPVQFVTGYQLLLGFPLAVGLAMTITHYICAKQDFMLWQKTELSQIEHSGKCVSFLAPSLAGTLRKARVRTIDREAAQMLAQMLNSVKKP